MSMLSRYFGLRIIGCVGLGLRVTGLPGIAEV